MKLNLGLDNGKRRVETQIEGENVAQMMQQMPELLNTMLRYLTLEETLKADRDLMKQHGVVFDERENVKEVTLVRAGAGSDDAGPGGEREGGVEPPPGV